MNRSTACFLIAPLVGLPAWAVDVTELPLSVQVIWLLAFFGTALVGGLFWALDRK